MTYEQEQDLANKIEDAEDMEVISESTTPCDFLGTRTTQKVMKSVSLGYTVTLDYTWTATYNNSQQLGGYRCTNITKTLEVNE